MARLEGAREARTPADRRTGAKTRWRDHDLEMRGFVRLLQQKGAETEQPLDAIAVACQTADPLYGEPLGARPVNTTLLSHACRGTRSPVGYKGIAESAIRAQFASSIAQRATHLEFLLRAELALGRWTPLGIFPAVEVATQSLLLEFRAQAEKPRAEALTMASLVGQITAWRAIAAVNNVRAWEEALAQFEAARRRIDDVVLDGAELDSPGELIVAARMLCNIAFCAYQLERCDPLGHKGEFRRVAAASATTRVADLIREVSEALGDPRFAWNFAEIFASVDEVEEAERLLTLAIELDPERLITLDGGGLTRAQVEAWAPSWLDERACDSSLLRPLLAKLK